MDKIIDRINVFSTASGISIRSIEANIGASNGVLSNAIKNGTSINSKWLSNIVDKYRNINPVWLLTGDGEMTKEDIPQDSIKIIHHPKSAEPVRDDQSVFLYDLEAACGLKELFDNKSQNIIDTIRIPNIPKCDGAIYVVGDSMYPILKSGDIVLYKEVIDYNYIFWGEMYLLSISVDDEEYITVKYIQRSEEGNDYIRLVSHNQHHSAKDVPISCIRALAIIKASIRLNTIA